MIAVMRPLGEILISPFEVHLHHTANELSKLAILLKSLDGETRVVMEATGNYQAPIAWLLNNYGFYVSVVNAMLVHDYGNNSLRRAKTDKRMPSSWQITASITGSLCQNMFQEKMLV